jgi:hypothetical protein
MFSSEFSVQNTDTVHAISNRKELYTPVVLSRLSGIARCRSDWVSYNMA